MSQTLSQEIFELIKSAYDGNGYNSIAGDYCHDSLTQIFGPNKGPSNQNLAENVMHSNGFNKFHPTYEKIMDYQSEDCFLGDYDQGMIKEKFELESHICGIVDPKAFIGGNVLKNEHTHHGYMEPLNNDHTIKSYNYLGQLQLNADAITSPNFHQKSQMFYNQTCINSTGNLNINHTAQCPSNSFQDSQNSLSSLSFIHMNALKELYPQISFPVTPCNKPEPGNFNFQFVWDPDISPKVGLYSERLNKVYASKDTPLNFCFKLCMEKLKDNLLEYSIGVTSMLHVRVMPIFKDFNDIDVAVKACPLHRQTDQQNPLTDDHFVLSHNPRTVYFKEPNTQRRGVLIPINTLTDVINDTLAILLAFPCFNSCKGGPSMKPIQLIFTLEINDIDLERTLHVLARSVVNIRVCAALLRDYKKEANIKEFKRKKYTTTSGVLQGIAPLPNTNSSHSAINYNYHMNNVNCGTTNNVTNNNVKRAKTSLVTKRYNPLVTMTEGKIDKVDQRFYDQNTGFRHLQKLTINGDNNELNNSSHLSASINSPNCLGELSDSNGYTDNATPTNYHEAGTPQHLIIRQPDHYVVLSSMLKSLEGAQNNQENCLKNVCNTLVSNQTHFSPVKNCFNDLNTQNPISPSCKQSSCVSQGKEQFEKQLNLTQEQLGHISTELIDCGLKAYIKLLAVHDGTEIGKSPSLDDIYDMKTNNPLATRKIIDILVLWARDFMRATKPYALSLPASLSSQQLSASDISPFSSQNNSSFNINNGDVSNHNECLNLLKNGLLIYRYRFKHTIMRDGSNDFS